MFKVCFELCFGLNLRMEDFLEFNFHEIVFVSEILWMFKICIWNSIKQIRHMVSGFQLKIDGSMKTCRQKVPIARKPYPYYIWHR